MPLRSTLPCFVTLTLAALLPGPILAQGELDVFVGPRMEKNRDLGHSLGSDEDLFYLLRTEQEKDGKRGFIDGWSRETLERVFSTPLQVPVVNAESFNVHEVIVGEKGLQLFYSFHSRTDGRVVLAMAALDQQGEMVGQAQELMEEPAAKKKTTQRFIVSHDKRSGMTVLLNAQTVHPENSAWFEPVMQVLTMDGSGQVRANSQITVGESGHCIFRDFTVDANGNAYLRIDHFKGKKDECPKLVLTVPASGGAFKKWCLPEPPRGLDYRDNNGFYFDAAGNITYVAPFADPSQYEDVKGYALRGVVVQSFDKESAERTLEKTHLFKRSYPKPDKPGSKSDAEMHNCDIMDISFQPDGKLNFYGAESFAKIGSGGENSFWGVRLDLEAGFEAPWGCGAQRQYSYYSGQESLFNYHVTQLKGVDYLMANEVRTNVGKTCSSMEDWNKQNANGDKTTPCYAVLSEGDAIGPRQRFTTDGLGTTQYFRQVNYHTNEEEILSVTSDDAKYLVRLRSK